MKSKSNINNILMIIYVYHKFIINIWFFAIFRRKKKISIKKKKKRKNIFNENKKTKKESKISTEEYIYLYILVNWNYK